MYVSLRQSGQERRRGVVLLTVLLVVAILTLAAFRFSEAMLSESRAVNSYDQANQARLLADAGINNAASLLATQSTQAVLNGNFTNNTDYFYGILVRDSDISARRGRFSILSPLPPVDPAYSTQTGTASTQFNYGVEDEAAKLNINALFQLDSSGTLLINALTNLSAYPSFPQYQALADIAPCIVDWIDPDDNPMPGGAESGDTYQQNNPPYMAKNAPLDSIEELLYVKGMTTQLLFGNDDNRNGILSQAQQASGGAGVIDRGLSAFLTVYSRELNVSSGGVPRIFVNDSKLPTLLTNLQTVLDPDVANYIVAYRLYGSTTQPAASSSTGTGGTTGTTVTGTTTARVTGTSGNGTTGMTITLSTPPPAPAANPNAPAPITWANGKGAIQTALNNLTSTSQGKTIASLYDLVNSQVTIPGQNGQSTVISSPFADPDSLRQNLPSVLDLVTTSNQSQIPARVNVNTASPAVLSSIPTASTTNPQALTQAQVQAIVTLQVNAQGSNGQAPDPIYLTPAWLLTETPSGTFTPAQVSAISKFITAGSQVYRFQSVGHFDGPGPSVRIEVVVDLNAGRPRIIYYRDLTSLGKGYDIPPPQN